MKKIIALVAIMSLVSCNKETDEVANQDISVNQQISQIMNTAYYWIEEMPYINPELPYTAKQFFKAHLVEHDRYSLITTAQQMSVMLGSGQEYGMGLELGSDQYSNIFVAVIFNQSPFYNEGVRRGWKIIEINDQTIDPYNAYYQLSQPTCEIKFQTPDGAIVTITKEQTLIDNNSLLGYKIIDGKVGYLAFLDFSEDLDKEIKPAFDTFQDAGITDLILDLRYNGGGLVEEAIKILNNLNNTLLNGKLAFTMEHNSLINFMDTSYYFESGTHNLNLNRLFVITTENTASASELIITALMPHFDVFSVGTNTYGKPVGMYIIPVDEYVMLPVTFRSVNADGYADYYDGITPDEQISEDSYKNWGSEEDEKVKSILNFINVGSFLKSAPELQEKNFGLIKENSKYMFINKEISDFIE
jgi:C-terminal processing protease CtpA/Prc